MLLQYFLHAGHMHATVLGVSPTRVRLRGTVLKAAVFLSLTSTSRNLVAPIMLLFGTASRQNTTNTTKHDEHDETRRTCHFFMAGPLVNV